MGCVSHIRLTINSQVLLCFLVCISPPLSGTVFCTVSSNLSSILLLQTYKIPLGSVIAFPTTLHYWIIGYKKTLWKNPRKDIRK